MPSKTNPLHTAAEGQWKKEAIEILRELSHSMRNPFSTIQSYLNILEMEEYTYTPEALKELTNILRETVDRSFKHIDEKILELKDGLKK
jgi:signal transduction histidine kinase